MSDPDDCVTDGGAGTAGFAEAGVLDACGWVPSGPCSPFESAGDDR